MTTLLPSLFAADLDGTLLPNTGKTPAQGCLERTRASLRRLHEAGVPVCYVTGRHLALARQGVELFRLPAPTLWICNVGTEIYNTAGQPDAGWRRSLGPDFDLKALRQALSGVPGLALQEADKQGRHKLSLYYTAPLSDHLRAEILRRASPLQNGMQIVASLEERSGRVLLDLVPNGAGKRGALEYVADYYDCARHTVFFAGDSGNDLDLLLSGVCGTLVGNTPPVVRALAVRLGSAMPDAHLFMAQTSYGDGVIEGLCHYGFRLAEPT